MRCFSIIEFIGICNMIHWLSYIKQLIYKKTIVQLGWNLKWYIVDWLKLWFDPIGEVSDGIPNHFGQWVHLKFWKHQNDARDALHGILPIHKLMAVVTRPFKIECSVWMKELQDQYQIGNSSDHVSNSLHLM